MAAAVADFRPEAMPPRQAEEGRRHPRGLALEPTPDILAELGERPTASVLVGFAAETTDVEAHGRAKLARKGADLVVANEVGREGTGFGSRHEPCRGRVGER